MVHIFLFRFPVIHGDLLNVMFLRFSDDFQAFPVVFLHVSSVFSLVSYLRFCGQSKSFSVCLIFLQCSSDIYVKIFPDVIHIIENSLSDLFTLVTLVFKKEC